MAICTLLVYTSRCKVEVTLLLRLASRVWGHPIILDLGRVIPRFASLIRSSKTARKAKTRKTKINFPLLPDGNNNRFARRRSSYKRKLARKLKKKTSIHLCISYKRKLVNRLLVYRGITVYGNRAPGAYNPGSHRTETKVFGFILCHSTKYSDRFHQSFHWVALSAVWNMVVTKYHRPARTASHTLF
jgi:hypothetical protein